MKLLLFMVGFIIAFLGNSSVRHFRKNQRRDYDVVPAKVVDIEKEVGKNNSKPVEVPVLEYEYKGVVHSGKHSVRIARFGKSTTLKFGGTFQIGQEVNLRVYKDNPEDAVIDDEKIIRVPFYIGSSMMTIGILLIAICVVWVFGWDAVMSVFD